MQSPPSIATESFSDAGLAVARLEEIYERNTKFLRERFEAYVGGEAVTTRVRAYYPFVRLTTATHARLDSRLAYGFVAGPGVHETSVTRPDLFRSYLVEQIGLLIQNHGVPVEIGESAEPIPIHFAYRRDINIEAAITTSENSAATRSLRDAFDVPDLAAIDDSIADGTFELRPGAAEPLSLFRAARVDYSLRRLYHYTGTDPEYFQNFVIFTNYQFYVDAFAQACQQRLQSGEAGLDAFVAPGNIITQSGGAVSGIAPARMPQMPAFHLVVSGYRGITLINIGTGPSNARNVTDHVAVLRPHAWLMLGHCAGLRNTQRLGDYVLAHGYVREDHVLDRELPPWVPIPALAEMQVALEEAVEDVTGLEGFELKRLMRTGTVASVDNRNWEISGPEVIRRLSQSRAVALDMESAAIAANGYRFRVPYGTLLCVSDKPLHGEIKLAGMASEFYRRRVGQHLEIGLKALERLKQQESERLHSRKLRSFAEVAFQ
ncbi:AMP nucleosidase [Bradyrhizobium sp. WBOS7]|uniref:AMP nucleosidase n=1 Tax=Bradyrhizobium betae TaxID=244734 RepID=A0AAE9NAU3_9BRAD|nr:MULTISPECIES: AMP nucleosidase [Bradyrhizobium]MDD1574522.1 AMP nucleosidase [Bradyrhizobium sp. WBOS1]UUO34696.1 AMP nucleosidase [Bradyrhizobium sp. WBOS01]MDD1530975.1 AMP nucleosidase [Bradyrhizobium sp. WBOS2]MDD1580558.1 AMP nucleosidase [Bradyrhizobium sp. WBOS7]MDD1603892.1 AMP nucleosidase [Bradyrhizobium sp. WBOS16]